MRRGKRVRSRRSGFTLLEILVVIAIIALLAAFVAPEFMGTLDQAERDTTQRIVEKGGNIDSALKLYKLHMGTYPEELSALIEEPEDDEEKDKWAGPYLDSTGGDLKDAWGTELNYKYPGEVGGDKMYDLWSSGPNKENDDGDEDDITNFKKED